jgi:hypothetical protein
LSDGSSICRAFVTSQSPVCACSAPGRRPAREQGCRVRLLGGDAPHDACICELTQLTSGALARCLADESASDDGWCYTTLTPTCGPAASERVGAVCPSGNWLKLQGGAALAEGETLFLACPAARIECD